MATSPFGGGRSSGGGRTTSPFGGGGGGSKKKKPKSAGPPPQQQMVRLATRLLAIKEPGEFHVKASQIRPAFEGLSPDRIVKISRNAGLSDKQTVKLMNAVLPEGRASKADLAALWKQYGSHALYSPKREQAQEALVEASRGWDRRTVENAASRAGVGPGEVGQIIPIGATQDGRPTHPGFPATSGSFDNLLSYLNRPGQAVLGGLTEGPEGFTRGVTGAEAYTPVQTALRATGYTAGGAAAREDELSPWVRGPANFVGEIATDPLTYIGAGTPFVARQAARSIGRVAVGETGERFARAGVLSPAARAVTERVRTGGFAALTDAEKAAVRATAPRLEKLARRAEGGLSVFGRPVPGTRFGAPRAVLPRETSGNFFGAVERGFRPRARIEQATRAGVLAPSTRQDVENVLSQVRAGRSMGGIREEGLFKETVAALRKAGVSRRQARRMVRTGEGLDPAREALDVAGGRTALEELSGADRAAADVLDRVRREDDALLKGLGRLRPEDEALAAKRAAVWREYEPALAKIARQIQNIEKKRYSQSGRYANALGKTKVLRGEAGERGERAALARGVAREQALQLREVAEQARVVRRQIGVDLVKVRGVERELGRELGRVKRGLAEIEREIAALGRVISHGKTAAERRGARVKLNTLEQEWADTAGRLDDLERKIGEAGARRGELTAMQKRAVVPDRPAIPPAKSPREVRKTGPEVAAAKTLGREGERLRTVVREKTAAERQLRRTMSRAQAKASSQQVTPIDRYYPHYPDAAARAEKKMVRPSGMFPGRTPGTLKERTRLQSASELGDVELNPVAAVGRHTKETQIEAARIRAFDDLAGMETRAENPLLIPEQLVKAYQKANPGKWEDVYAEMTAPVMSVDDAGRIVTRDDTWLVHKAIEPELRRVVNATTDKEIRRGMEYINALWARYATATFGFISRNVLQGNLYMGMVLAGAHKPKTWARAFGVMRRMENGVNATGNPLQFIDDASERAIVEGAFTHNAVESGFMESLNRQVAQTVAPGRSGKVRSVFARSKASPVSPEFLPLKAMSRANTWAENWSRLAVYMDRIEKGFHPAEAAAQARHYLLDYRDLSPVNEAARIFNPFATWTYKTVPLLTAELFQNPRKITIPLHLLNAVGEEGGRTQDESLMAKWAEQGGAVRIPGTDQAFLPDTPIHSVAETLNPLVTLLKREPGWQKQLGRETVNALGVGGGPGGALVAGVEAGTGTKLFSGQEFHPGTQVSTPLPFKPFFGKFMPWEARNALDTLIPLLSTLSSVAPQGDYEKSVQSKRLVSKIAGLGVIPVDHKMEKGEFYRRLRLLQTLQQAVTTSGGEVPLKEWNRTSGSGGWGQ